jgi:signal transduction histidine kinase
VSGARLPDSRRLLEIVAGGCLFAALAGDVLSRGEYRGPAWLSVVLCAAATLSWVERRRSPLAFAAIASGSAIVLAALLDNRDTSVLPVYTTIMPAYTVAAYATRRQAGLGLAVCLAGVVTLSQLGPPTTVGYVLGIVLCLAAWAAGRGMRNHRAAADELEHRAERLQAEQADRQRLAVADERTRIARELHAAIAGRVSAMVVQTAAAQRLLDHSPEAAEEAMAAIELAGRDALTEMRRVLGVLRRAGDAAELAPQPGLGQLHNLIEQARAGGSDVELRVHGHPGPLPASVDLGIYRLIEEALAGTVGAARVQLVFGPDVRLEITAAGEAVRSWPTLAMHERVGLCRGLLTVEPDAEAGRRLTVRLPRAFEGAAA